MDEMLTVEEVAEMLKVKPLTVRQMFRERRLRAFKIGKAWRTTRAWLQEDLIAMSRGEPVPPPSEIGLYAEKPENRTGTDSWSSTSRRQREGTLASDAAGTASKTIPSKTGEPAADMVMDRLTTPPEAKIESVGPALAPDENPQTVPPMPDNLSAFEEKPVQPENPQQYLF